LRFRWHAQNWLATDWQLNWPAWLTDWQLASLLTGQLASADWLADWQLTDWLTD
jgi:hypothetical protein